MRRLVVCSQKSFYVTNARKDEKNRQNTLFLLKKDEVVPIKQILLDFPFHSTKNSKKEFCEDNSVQKLLEMCFVQHVEMKSVFQPIKRLVSTIVKSTKPAVTF